MPRSTIYFPDELDSKIKDHTKDGDSSKSKFVQKCIRFYLKNKGKNGSVENLKENLESKNEEIKDLKDELNKKDEEIRKLNREIGKLEEKKERIKELKQELEKKEDREQELKNIIEELKKEKENTATFGEWVMSINPFARFFVKTGLMMAGWKIPERVKEE